MINPDEPEETYESKREKERKKMTEELENELNDKMEDRKIMQLVLVSRKKKKKKKDDSATDYSKQFEIVDGFIEMIEDAIIMCVPIHRILAKINNELWYKTHIKETIRPTVFFLWMESTEHIDRIKAAKTWSAENQMNFSKEFMESWILNPKLNIANVSLIREIGLWHSRKAGFSDSKKYGKKIMIEDDRPQQRVLKGHDIKSFLEEATKAAEKIKNAENAEDVNEEDYEEEDN